MYFDQGEYAKERLEREKAALEAFDNYNWGLRRAENPM